MRFLGKQAVRPYTALLFGCHVDAPEACGYIYYEFSCILSIQLCAVRDSEQRGLRLLQLDALASLVVILLVELKADEVALLFYTSNGGGAIYNSVHKLV